MPAVPMSSVRASSGVPWKTSLYSNQSRGTGTNESTEPATSAASAAIPGSTHSDPRTYSPTSSRSLLPASPNIRSREWPVERIVQSRLIVSSPLCGGSLRGALVTSYAQIPPVAAFSILPKCTNAVYPCSRSYSVSMSFPAPLSLHHYFVVAARDPAITLSRIWLLLRNPGLPRYKIRISPPSNFSPAHAVTSCTLVRKPVRRCSRLPESEAG